jgi:tripartite ATP-independent transporter DctM subunit
MGTVALPEMKKYKYGQSLATGTVAAGGTLGILIPPSATFVFYAILTEQSVGKLFIAGILPGIVLALLFMLTIYLQVRIRPGAAPRGQQVVLKEKLLALKGVWSMLVLFLVVMGGIYTGIFTPTEAAGIGAFGAFIFSLGKRKITRENFVDQRPYFRLFPGRNPDPIRACRLHAGVGRLQVCYPCCRGISLYHLRDVS